MKHIAYYHGYPTKLGNKHTSWRSCYQWKPFGLRWISAVLAWAFHNYLCYMHIRHTIQADRVIFTSEYTREHFIQSAIKYRLIRS